MTAGHRLPIQSLEYLPYRGRTHRIVDNDNLTG